MQFYTYDYIVQRSQFNDIALYVLSFLALIALLFATFKYFRNRLVTRYRDLIVIFVLAVAFLGGTQWNSFNQTKADSEQTSASCTHWARRCRRRPRRSIRIPRT